MPAVDQAPRPHLLAVLSTTILLAGDAGMNTGRMVDALAAQVRP